MDSMGFRDNPIEIDGKADSGNQLDFAKKTMIPYQRLFRLPLCHIQYIQYIRYIQCVQYIQYIQCIEYIQYIQYIRYIQ